MCVRVVQANGMDLSLFQFDYDLSFSVFLMNADKTIYGRFGTRSKEDAMHDISMEGLCTTLRAALALHAAYPANKAALAGKQGAAPEYASPEQFPSLQRFKAFVDPGPNVRKSCMHCHMIHDAEHQVARAKGPVGDELLYQYPLPDWLGLSMDIAGANTIKSVSAGSPADTAGFKAEDQLSALDGQPIISTADVQWVLQHASTGALKANVLRDGKGLDLQLALAEGWRRKGEFTWRTSTWSIRQWAGGMLCEELDDETREKLALPANKMALKVMHVGEYPPHNIALKAGLKKGDVIVGFEGRSEHMSESEILACVAQKKKPGDSLEVTVLRAGQNQTLKWTLP